jgi:hypothetical protein
MNTNSGIAFLQYWLYVLFRGGRYQEGDAKFIVEHTLSVVAYCRLPDVVPDS